MPKLGPFMRYTDYIIGIHAYKKIVPFEYCTLNFLSFFIRFFIVHFSVARPTRVACPNSARPFFEFRALTLNFSFKIFWPSRAIFTGFSVFMWRQRFLFPKRIVRV